MKKLRILSLALILVFSLFISQVGMTRAAEATDPINDACPDCPQNLIKYTIGPINDPTTGTGAGPGAWDIQVIGGPSLALTGKTDPKTGVALKPGLLPVAGQYLAMLYQNQPGTQEYVADLLDNIGLPTVGHAYAQGTGYKAMSLFLPMWKVFRNLAYTLYIIMFIIVGIMIMLRTKVNAQTIITIQSALPNLLITLILITFSYAIVGFMIDIMYFLIYFMVYLLKTADIIATPVDAITRLMTQDAWGVVLGGGRNAIVAAVAMAINGSLMGLGAGVVGGIGFLGGALSSWLNIAYLLVAVWLAVSMIKLMFTLVKCYFMLLVQTITAPIQILMNAVPGSKAFSTWLKTTASYLLPFPVVACMFLFAAILIGDPSRATLLQGANILGDNGNPFGINKDNELYTNYGGSFTSGKNNTGNVWLPPFTLVDYKQEPASLMVILGFFILTMTPAAAKMAQDWLQVKESPYSSEIMSGMGVAVGVAKYPWSMIESTKKQQEQVSLAKQQARWNAEEFKKVQGS